LSSFDKIKQNLNYDEGSYSRIHLQKKAKKGGQKRILEELSEIFSKIQKTKGNIIFKRLSGDGRK